jgi:molecular chaperone GrpE (heat shock protein)
MSWLARIFGKRPAAAPDEGDTSVDGPGTAEIAELCQKLARTQARQGLALEEIESKLEAGFADLRGALDRLGSASESSLSFDDCFDAIDALAEAARLAPDEAHGQGLLAVVARLDRFVRDAGFERQSTIGETPDARRFRVVGTEVSEVLAPGKATRVVRAAICRQGKLVREGEVIVSVSAPGLLSK